MRLEGLQIDRTVGPCQGLISDIEINYLLQVLECVYSKTRMHLSISQGNIEMDCFRNDLLLQAASPSHYELINKAYVTEEEIRERPDEVYEAEEDYRGRGDGELTFLRGAIIRNVEQDLDHVGWSVNLSCRL